MLNLERLQARLPIDGWGRVVEFHPKLPSTNDHAWRLAQQGAPHGTLVVANEQTAGKGRGKNQWFTPPDAALAFSLVIRPEGQTWEYASALSALGGLAVVEALQEIGLEAKIKWPNDVLVRGRKVCGVLSEASWEADLLEFAIVGIGVNVRRDSVPPQDTIQWPAACLEDLRGQSVQRLDLLVDIVGRLAAWYRQLGNADLAAAWERYLAFKGQVVALHNENQAIEGRIQGLDLHGRLIVQTSQGIEHLASGAWQFSQVDRFEN
jgi:BirA family biotin operon repressor/biotin-[acetyl-CoA-carboxylase] ligase